MTYLYIATDRAEPLPLKGFLAIIIIDESVLEKLFRIGYNLAAQREHIRAFWVRIGLLTIVAGGRSWKLNFRTKQVRR